MYNNNTHAQYLETEILSADPLKLVSILYRGAVEAVSTARTHLASGATAEARTARSRQISKAWEIVQELNRSLDHKQGGDISHRLAELYSYVQQRLLEGNAQQADAPLAEAESLLKTLADAWRELAQPTKPVSAQMPVAPSMESYIGLSCTA